MSVTIMTEVWKLAIETMPKMVLLKLADCANDEGGNVFPGVPTIRLAVGVASDSTVKRRLRQFKALGILTEDKEAQSGRRRTGRGNYKIWRIDLDVARRYFPPAVDGVQPPNLAELARAAKEEKRGSEPPFMAYEKGGSQDQESGALRTEKGARQDCKGGPDIALESSRTIREPSSQIPSGICEPMCQPENSVNSSGHLFALAPPASPPSKREAEAAFEQFWQAYPRKAAKGRARKAWSTAITKADLQTIINGATRYGREQADKDPEFIKHPATWLAGECWLDEPAARRSGRNRQGPRSSVEAFARAAGIDPDTLG